MFALGHGRRGVAVLGRPVLALVLVLVLVVVIIGV